ncbi:MAG: Ig-like domain-containing protein, partial [Aeromicrobium sp.]|uniref:Ig-like domain-containing protein n=1 Tax=Aeromicrobium sp. TaxID=1871063 RepID=UPI0039E3FD5A
VTLTVTESAVDDTAVVVPGTPVTVDVLSNDGITDADADTLSLVDPDTGELVTTLTVDGGVWSVVDGQVVFTPNDDVSTTPPAPVTYVVFDGDGNPYSAVLTVTVAEPAVDDTVTGTEGSGPLVIDPLANDGNPNLDPTTVRLVDPVTGLPVTTVEFPEGTWTVDTTTGRITFTPADGYTGAVPPVTYVVQDSQTLTWYSGQITGEITAADTTTTTPTTDTTASASGLLPGTGSVIGVAALFIAMIALALGLVLLRLRHRPTSTPHGR